MGTAQKCRLSRPGSCHGFIYSGIVNLENLENLENKGAFNAPLFFFKIGNLLPVVQVNRHSND